jgi:acetyl esterase/lipase
MPDEREGMEIPAALEPIRSPPQSALGRCRYLYQAVSGVDCYYLLPPDKEPRKRIIYLHGGAFTTGPVVCHWGMLSYVCEKTGISAVLVDYGLAPEKPFPAGLNDVLAVCKSLRAEGEDGGAIYLMGDSAGGGLALSAVLALRDLGRQLPEKLVLLSPWLDLTLSNPEIESVRGYDQLLEKEGLLEAAGLYASGRDPAHYLLSPVNGDPFGLPPTLLEIGSHDILVCDCRRFRDKARSAGVSIVYLEWDGMFHDWMTQAPLIKEAKQAVEAIVDFLKAD